MRGGKKRDKGLHRQGKDEIDNEKGKERLEKRSGEKREERDRRQ